MQINITQKEYDAIHFAWNQVTDAIEGAEDEDYIKAASEATDNLHSICEKFKAARAKANELNYFRSYIRSRNKWMPQKDVDKLARKAMKEANR